MRLSRALRWSFAALGAAIAAACGARSALSSTPLPAGNSSSSLAFAFWGGDFYVFTSEGDGITDVARYRPSDGTVTGVTTLGATVVGAGVSTCAPQQ